MARKTKAQEQATRQQIIEAARVVFHRYGVSHATLAMVAHEARLTRGAIYWHFKDKVDLFLAVREEALLPVFGKIDAILGAGHHADPLDAIEAALKGVFHLLEHSPQVAMVLETVANRCEQIAEFAHVRSDLNVPVQRFLSRLEDAYRRADASGILVSGLDPPLVARDTQAFTEGLVHRVLAARAGFGDPGPVAPLIALHMALRRSRREDAADTAAGHRGAVASGEPAIAAPSGVSSPCERTNGFWK